MSWRGSQHRRIARAMLTVGAFVLIGKCAGAAREMAIAWRYGISSTVDVYVFALLLVAWVPTIVTSVLNAVLVPLIRRLPVADRDRFSAELAGAAVLLGGVLTLLLLWLAPALADSLSGGFDDDSRLALGEVLRMLSPAAMAMLLTALFSARLLARERHANTLLEAVPALLVLALVLSWPAEAVFAPLVVGTLAGLMLQSLLLAGLMVRSGMPPGFAFRFSHPAWRDFRRSVGTLVIGTVIIGLAPPIDQLIAARLGEGAIASLSYAGRLLALALGLGATAVARAILPVLSDPDQPPRQRLQLARQWCALLFVAGLATALIGWWLTPWAVALIFERGAFDAADTARVAEVVRYGLSQLPFYFAGIVLVQLFASLGHYRLIVQSSVVAIVVKVVGGVTLGAWLGVPGITLSTGLMYTATCAWLLWRSLAVSGAAR